jgi:hypothetical protein
MNNVSRIVIIIFAGSTMIAHGLRMMSQGLLYPNSIYPAPVPTSIDFWFDWFTLAVLGSILFYRGIISFYDQMKKQKSDENICFPAT